MIAPTPVQLRRRIRRRRRALPRTEQLHHAEAVARRVSVSALLLSHQCFALYCANDGEIGTEALIDRLLGCGKTVALPVLDDKRLAFYRYTTDTPLVRNRFGIPEPDARRARHLPLPMLGVIFAPLVGFDRLGYRLGMGGGYYDRTLARFAPGKPAAPHAPLFVGLAHALQEITNEVPRPAAQPWDIPLDAVITERETVVCSARAARYADSR